MSAIPSWYAIKTPSDSAEAEVYIYDEIGGFGVGAKQFIDDLRPLSGRALSVRINSPGGSVIEGNAIFNALARHTGGVTVHIDGLAASMASVIAMAGAPVVIAENALLMIHNPWTVGSGDAEELRKQADLLDKIKDNIVAAYRKKTTMSADEIITLMDAETWLTAEEAVTFGFADLIEEPIAAAASLTPSDLRAKFDTFSKAKMDATLEIAALRLELSAKTQIAEAAEAALTERNEALAALTVRVDDAEARATAAEVRAVEAETVNAGLTESLDEAAEENKNLAAKLATLEAQQAVTGIQSQALPPTAEELTESRGGIPAPVTEWIAAVESNDRAKQAEIFAKHKDLIFAHRRKLSDASR